MCHDNRFITKHPYSSLYPLSLALDLVWIALHAWSNADNRGHTILSPYPISHGRFVYLHWFTLCFRVFCTLDILMVGSAYDRFPSRGRNSRYRALGYGFKCGCVNISKVFLEYESDFHWGSPRAADNLVASDWRFWVCPGSTKHSFRLSIGWRGWVT